jgi:hypothetical protein
MTNKLIACAIFVIVAVMIAAIIRGTRDESSKTNLVTSYEGVDRLKYLCFVFALVSLLSAIENINSIVGRIDLHTSKFVISYFFTWYGRLYAAFNSLIAAALGYGIHKRARMAWKLGWILMILAYVRLVLSVVYHSWRYEKISDFPGYELPIMLVSVTGLIVFAYWGNWWKRQKGYFDV